MGKENRTSPVSGQRRLSISILLQRLITLLCTSHTGQCAPSLKWYKIHTVQPVPPSWHRREGRGQSQGGQAQSRGNTLPEVLGAPGKRGFGQGGRQEAAPASGSQELPSCASWAAPPEGPRGWRCSVPATLTPKQPLPHQAPAPGVWSLSWSWGRHPNHPGTPTDGKRKRSAGMKRLKNRDGARSNKRSPFG